MVFSLFGGGKDKPCQHKKYNTVAFDSSYNTTHKAMDGHESTHYHHLYWLKCNECGHRKFDKGSANQHSGVEMSRLRWIEQNIVSGADKLDVYDEDYVATNPKDTTYLKYKPVIGVGKILKTLKTDVEFKELHKHQLVEDALGQLEVAIKLCMNNTPPNSKKP